MDKNPKFLVELVHSLDHRFLFFLGWFVIAGGFAALMLSFQKNVSRRNFKEDSEKKSTRAVAKKD